NALSTKPWPRCTPHRRTGKRRPPYIVRLRYARGADNATRCPPNHGPDAHRTGGRENAVRPTPLGPAPRHQPIDDAHHLAVGLFHAAQVAQRVFQGLAVVGGERRLGLVVHGGVRRLDLPEGVLAPLAVLGVEPLAEAAFVLVRQLRRRGAVAQQVVVDHELQAELVQVGAFDGGAAGGGLDALAHAQRQFVQTAHGAHRHAGGLAETARLAALRLDAPIDLIDAGLHLPDARDDLAGGLGALFRQLAHLAGHHGEAAPGLAGARRLDGRVERQQVGLRGDAGDQLDDAVDLPGTPGQRLYLAPRLVQAVLHVRGAVLQHVELALVVQRRRGHPVGVAPVALQAPGQVVEGLPELAQGLTEAGQMPRQALLERLPALLLPGIPANLRQF